jgi:serine/threonine protein kinase
MSGPDRSPVPPPSGPAGPRDEATGESPAITEAEPGNRRDPPLEATEPYAHEVDLGAGQERPPELTEPCREPAEVLAEALGHVRLDPAAWPGSIGRVAHYEVLEVVGRGAMGVVVRAYDSQLCRTVALKLMSPQLMLSSQARERFFREARAAAGINHPNVVTIHAVAEHGGVPFLVMEYVGGCTLMDRIRSDAPLDIADILRISAQIASGLAAAHQQGIIHRDIKPANIMLEDSIERVKITDFGLARVIVDHSDLTSQGVVVGTPAYMSPEQVSGDPLDPRSDLFSLGCVMYAMMAGYSPFRGEHPLGIARRVTSQQHVSLAEISKDVPNYFIQIVDRLLAKDPKDRYQTAAALVADLTQHLARVNSDRGSKSDLVAPGASRPRLTKLALIAVALLAVLSAASAALWSWRRTPQEHPSTPGKVAIAPASGFGSLLRVAQNGQASYTTIAAALRHATPDTTIRVEDAVIYDEPLFLRGSSNHEGVRLEATAGATLKAPGDRPVLTIDAAARVKVSGFRIEAASGQHAIEMRGACPGAILEDCQIVCAPDSPVAAVYLHAGASGTEANPIRLRHLQIKCGGVGVVLGGLEDKEPVSRVLVTDSLVQGPSREYGIPVVLQVSVQHVVVSHNTFSTGSAGISLSFDALHGATDVLVTRNSLGNFHYALAFNESSPEQAIHIDDNLIVEADTIQVSGGRIEPYAACFHGNWWERSANVDETLASRIARLTDPLPLEARDPGAASYLKPAATSDAAFIPGRYSAPSANK